MNNKSLIQNETVFLNEVTELVQKARDTANSAVSSIIVVTYWNIGKKIVEQEQAGNDRAEYGKQVIEVSKFRIDIIKLATAIIIINSSYVLIITTPLR